MTNARLVVVVATACWLAGCAETTYSRRMDGAGQQEMYEDDYACKQEAQRSSAAAVWGRVGCTPIGW